MHNIDLSQWIDVFGFLGDIGVSLAFRPLGRLEAAALNLKVAERGVIVNSGRPLQRQRYSAAHELGHLEFDHETSLDLDMLMERAPSGRWSDEEKLAESFAAWFLMPHALIHHSLQRLGVHGVIEAADVYQLALRMGTSYESTARHLVSAQFSTRQRSQQWLKVEPAEIKRQTAGAFVPELMRNDVHVLSLYDNANSQLVRAGDRVLVRLDERPTSGYRWHLEPLPSFLRVLDDSYVSAEPEIMHDGSYATGGLEKRQFVLEIGEPEMVQKFELVLHERRAWLPESIATTRFQLTVETAERLGVPLRYFAAA